MTAKRKLKDKLPPPLRALAMAGFHYAQRLRFWRMVMKHVRPADAESRKVLRRSLRRAPFTAFGRFDRWENPQLLGAATLDVIGYGRFTCRPRMDDLFHVLPQAQPGVRKAIEDHLKPGMTFIDAGANIGFFTILGARLVGPEGRVIAVEMMPDTAAILRHHIALNGLTNVTVVEQALSARAGEEVLAHVPRDHAGQASIVAESFRDYAVDEVRVLTTTLDAITQGIERIDFMKVDLEGAEALAFDGARAMLARTDAVIFESRPDDPASVGATDRIRAAGFTPQLLDGYNTLAKRD